MSRPRIGMWLIGARGNVASTVLTGLAALQHNRVAPIGLVTTLPPFDRLDMPDWADLVPGGHEIRDIRLFDQAMGMATDNHAIDAALVEELKPELDAIDKRIRPGTLHGVGSTIAGLATLDVPRDDTPRKALRRLGRDIADFFAAEKLTHVVVVNVASTEPAGDADALPARWSDMERMLDDPNCPLPASTLYAIAALELGCSYINFTPSLGSTPPALDELARLHHTRHMGRDGKTGETLMKSVLAPMFAHRHLEVMSWAGFNIFGNLDGKVLSDPANKQAKVTTKDRLLREILGYVPQTHVSLDCIDSLGDWKTAWDHIHFRGFLGTPMTLQFIWQGCDSLLAAPLVLDMVRLADAARRRGDVGTLAFLAGFFKSPLGVAEQGYIRQFQMLEAWANAAPAPARS
jgi:myo-inositol-1-phosphate synthase